MKYKILFIVFLISLLFIPLVNALDFDNGIKYENDDLTVNLENGYFFGIGEWFGFSEELGTATLKSHKSVDEIKRVGTGNQIVIWYEFDFLELYKDGLGDVEFTDMKTNERAEINWKYVYWSEKEIFNATTSKYEMVGEWLPYNSKDIIKGKSKIGIEVEMERGDWLDGIWTIGGKRISRHAEFITTGTGLTADTFQGSLNVGDLMGINITTNGSVQTIYSIGKLNGGSENLSLITDASNTILASATFVGDIAIFGGGSGFNLTANTIYHFIVTNDGLENWATQRDETIPYDVDLGWIIMTGPISNGIDDLTDRGWAIDNFTLIVEVPPTPPTITLDFPTNDSLFSTTNQVVYNATIFAVENVGNVTFFLNDASNETNNTITNDTVYTFTKNLADGFIISIFQACDNLNNCINSSIINITVNTTPNIDYGIGVPVNYFNSSTNAFEVNVTLTEDLFLNITFDLYDRLGTINRTVTFTNASRKQDWINLIEGYYSYNVTTFTSTNEQNSTATRNITIDIFPPDLNITAPNTTINLHTRNNNRSVNWSVSDISLDTCILEYEGINRTVICLDNTTEINITNAINRSLIFYVNDTFGRINVITHSWDYRVFEDFPTFTGITIEGNEETFIANVTFGASDGFSSGVFNYNSTSNTVSAINIDGDIYNLTSTLIIPNTDSNQNLTFFWTINLLSGVQVNLTEHNQTVQNLAMDNCTTFTTLIFNYTIVDEENQTQLTGTDFELSVNISDRTKTIEILNFSSDYGATNPALVCLNINLTSNVIYALDSTAKYEASDHVIEYYNIQNFTLEDSSIPQVITLFDLLSDDSTEFQITFKDSNFVAVENAIIHINRQYISEGVFKTVEIPRTDSNGQTVVHLVEKDIVYNMIVFREGILLGTFTNLIAFCEDVVVGSCFISLNALEAEVEIFDYDVEIGVISNFDYNETTRNLLYTFATTDGAVRNISLNAVQLDQLGNNTICTESLVSASGSLICAVPVAVGNETIIVDIFVDGDLRITNYITAGTEFDLGDAGIFLMFFLVLSLALMFTQSKTATIIGVVIGFISSILLSFVRGGIISVGSSVVWLVIMASILIWKLNSQKQT